MERAERRVARANLLARPSFSEADKRFGQRQDPPRLLKKFRYTFELVKFSHSIFALPFALASMLVAAQGFPDLKTIALIIGCMVLARTSAMAFNRYADAAIDAENPRTQQRHLPQGLLSKRYVLMLTILCGLGFIALSYFLNFLSFVLAPGALLFIWFYSLTKRFTHFTQLFLGLALGLTPTAAWIAVTGTVALPPLSLSAAVASWVAGFDIVYATQDYDFDRRHGIKSLVVKLGIARALTLARLLHVATVLLLLPFAMALPDANFYYTTCAIVALLLTYEHSLIKPTDLSRVNQAFFTLNGWIGILYFIGTSIAVFSN